MPINRAFFFQQIRTSLFTNKLSQGQVDGINFILDEWESRHAGKDDRWLAYALGTAFHETAFKMQPIDEFGSSAYFERRYGPFGDKPQRARANGNTEAGFGAKYHGRGYVQLTWKNNYAAMSAVLSLAFGKSIDLVANPDEAKLPAYAAVIMFHGMEHGTFTGRKFADYFTAKPNGQPDKDDWVGARKIIVGTDHDIDIAAYGRKFYAALSYLH
ncbi:hypothetical protein [Oryzibacter oryziterrae]|uniref:hypothetical protein n=1 Tax=Oryzibacter oryziterrae TaxID=2766474 RepID=UPI001F176805|nr:hypothetical protein [Oryzibacter oryziterrae]